MFYSANEESFELWQRALQQEHGKPAWNIHDQAARAAVTAFERFHIGKAGYVGPTWQLIKAMLWVEGGGPAQKDEWLKRPMQIGVPGDGGIIDVTTKPEMALIIPPELRVHMQVNAIREEPARNIQAALALLHYKFASFIRRPKPVPADTTISPPVTSASPNRAYSHHPRHQHPQTELSISAWAPFHPVLIYQRYNVGDGAYASKLAFCLKLINA